MSKASGETGPIIARRNSERDEGVHFHEFWKFAAEQPRIDLLDDIEARTTGHTRNKSAEMCPPIDPRRTCGEGDIQANIDGKEIPRQVDLAENPQAQQRAQHSRDRARRADREVGSMMSDIATNRRHDQA